jgi:16S rRNA processing protein RimM
MPKDWDDQESMVLMGVIQGAHGLHGHVSIRTFTEETESLEDYSPLYNEKGDMFEIESLKQGAGGSVLAKLKGVSDRTSAEKLKGTGLYLPRNILEDLSDENYYYVDLIGLEVVLEDKTHYGFVKNILNFGAGDILEILQEKGSLILVQFRHEFVPFVDLKKGIMVIRPPHLVEEKE